MSDKLALSDVVLFIMCYARFEPASGRKRPPEPRRAARGHVIGAAAGRRSAASPARAPRPARRHRPRLRPRRHIAKHQPRLRRRLASFFRLGAAAEPPCPAPGSPSSRPLHRRLPIDRKDRHVATVLAGIRCTQGRPPEQKEAILPEDLLAMIATLDLGDLRGLRDRAVLLIGFAGGLRRSEIVGLDCRREDGLSGGWIEFFDEGLLLTLRGKTGWREVEIGRGSSEATCPVAALETWLKFARISIGPVFRRVVGGKVGAERLTDRHVARLVKTTAMAAGVRGDLSEGEREKKFSGHSLRAGLASSAEVDERYVQKQLGHASAEMTRRYQRRRDRFRVNLTKAAGL